MAIGSQFAQYINPLLSALRALGGSARAAEARAAVADLMELGDSVLEERLSSGPSRFDNQVGWARYYLVRAGYLDSTRRGVWALTEKGRTAERLSDAQIGELVRSVIAAWGRTGDTSIQEPESAEEVPPDEVEADYRTRLLAILQELPPSGFERLCQRLAGHEPPGTETLCAPPRSGQLRSVAPPRRRMPSGDPGPRGT